jgi:hypothetical protein
MRSTFVACPRKFAWEYLDHWRPISPSVHLHAGKAWAEAMEAARRAFYCDGRSTEEAEALALAALIHHYGTFDCPPDSPKSLERLSAALVYYFTCFPLDADPATPYIGTTGPMVEFSFVLPIDDSLRHPVTGDPILFSGRADMVANFAGAVTIYDDKTTSSLGSSWASQWDLRGQFSGYSWAAREYGIPVSQVLVRGISILKTKFDHAQALSARPTYAIERWHAQFVRDIRRAITCWEEGYWDYNLSDACSSFGSCLFKQPCMSANSEPWLKGYFIRRAWDPVTRTETLLPEPPQDV